MKGLNQIPSKKEIAKALEQLQFHSNFVSQEDIIVWGQWSRMDPRLAQLLVEFLANHWQKYSPQSFNKMILEFPWGVALGPLFEFAKYRIELKTRPLYRAWMACALSGLSKPSPQQFFIGTRKFGGTEMFKDARHSLTPFMKWNFLCRDSLITQKLKSQKHTHLSKAKRNEILNILLLSFPRISVKDYIQASQGTISRRVAQLDLKAHPHLKKVGRTSGSVYSLRKRLR